MYEVMHPAFCRLALSATNAIFGADPCEATAASSLPLLPRSHHAFFCSNGSHRQKPLPSDSDLERVLRQVRLGLLLDRGSASNGKNPGKGLDHLADWSGILSLGEQQRLAFARQGFHI